MRSRARPQVALRRVVGLLLVGALSGAFGVSPFDEARDARAQRNSPRSSSLIYPTGESSLRVNHAHPAHRRLRCQRCHEGTTRSVASADSLTPKESACLPCHASEVERSTSSKRTCGLCHLGYGEGGAQHVPVDVRVAPRLKFSHQLHARRGVACLDCHRGIDESEVPAEGNLPSMRSCFRCHGGPRATAPSACSTCHETAEDGLLRTHYPDGWLDPPAWLGMKHDRDFLTRHRWVAADHGELCGSCHREEDCSDCHDGRVQRLQIHPNDYLSIHAADSRRDGHRCVSCHSSQTFCSECHSRLGLSTIAPPRIRVGARYHPPADVWSSGPQWHGREARRSLDSCTSCHVERDCIVCHGAAGVGGAGVSPHPPSFNRRCGEALRFNPRACRSCHGDVAALRSLCP